MASAGSTSNTFTCLSPARDAIPDIPVTSGELRILQLRLGYVALVVPPIDSSIIVQREGGREGGREGREGREGGRERHLTSHSPL